MDKDQLAEIKRLWADKPEWVAAATWLSPGAGIQSEVWTDTEETAFVCACSNLDDVNAYRISLAPAHITALVNEVERLSALLADLQAERDALEAEASVYRITVLSVNVAAGQGED